MVKPIALCLEREATDTDARYVRCTARPGRESGLAIGLDGSILWCEPKPLACEIWVAHDQRLVVLRPAGSPPICINRARRNLQVPEAHAVFVLDGDELVVGAHRYRLHVHGMTDELQPPRPLRVARGVAVAAAMAMSLGCSANEGSSSQPPGDATPARVSATPSTGSAAGGVGGYQVSTQVATGGARGFQLGTQVATGGVASDAGDDGSGGHTIEIVSSPPA